MGSPASAHCARTVCKCFRIPFEAYRARRHRGAPGSSARRRAKKCPQLAAGLKGAPRRPILIYTLRSARIFHRWRYARSENSPEHRFDRFEICIAVARSAGAPEKHAARHPRHHRSTRDNSHPRRRPLGRSSRDRSTPRDDATWTCARPPHAPGHQGRLQDDGRGEQHRVLGARGQPLGVVPCGAPLDPTRGSGIRRTTRRVYTL